MSSASLTIAQTFRYRLQISTFVISDDLGGVKFSPKYCNPPVLLDPIFFHSEEKSGGREILLGSRSNGLSGGCPGYVLGVYPLNSGSLFDAVR